MLQDAQELLKKAAWQEEIVRRLEDVQSGKVKSGVRCFVIVKPLGR
jgi:hypothetical protein